MLEKFKKFEIQKPETISGGNIIAQMRAENRKN